MEEEANFNNRLRTIVAVLIAVVTVVGALVVWRAAVAVAAAGEAESFGRQALMRAEETRALNAVAAYEDYAAYTAYRRYAMLGDLLAEAMLKVTDARRLLLLDGQRTEAEDLALANRGFFPGRYLDRDGSYALERQLGEMWADAAREGDLNADPYFARADLLRGKANFLLIAAMVLGPALVCFTVVEIVGGRRKYLLVTIGALLAAGAAAAALLIDLLVQ